jgi:RNA polymerase sigma-70 factor, ECF subfamily
MEKIMHEKELITALKEGDKNAIGLVYDNYGAALYGVVLRIVQSPEAAEEVVQDVFVKIFKNIQSFDENKGKFYTWAINIAKNTAIDATRTSDFKNRQKTEQFDFVVYSQTQPSSNLSVDTIGLREIVDKLDEKHRAVIDLAYFQGYTQSEIEEEMNIPIGTVKTRLRLAIKELRKAFG